MVNSKHPWKAWIYLAPALALLMVFTVWPIINTVRMALLENYSGLKAAGGATFQLGFGNFVKVLKYKKFLNCLKNTVLLGLGQIVFVFPCPIIFALLLNETKGRFKRASQTILYAPHFLSTVVVVGMINTMLSPSFGVVNTIIEALGGERIYFMTMPGAFRHLYVWSGVWQGMGWGAIIYLAALAAVDPELHEAATIDGASRIQRIRYINIPTIVPTIIILLIMRMGSLVSVGYEKVYLLQNDLNVEVSEVISTYVYKRGLLQNNYSFSTAVGLFNNVVNIALLLITNFITRRVSDTSLF